MKIRRFNENIKSDFITIEEVKDIVSHLYDHDNTSISIDEKWISFGTEAHLSSEQEYKDDIKVIVVGISIKLKESVPFYVEYGVDSHSIKRDDLSNVVEILKDTIDISNQLEGVGYDLHTEIVDYFIRLTISKKGSLKS